MGYSFIPVLLVGILVISTAQQSQQENVLKKIHASPRPFVYNIEITKDGKQKKRFMGIARLPGDNYYNPKRLTKCIPLKKVFKIQPMTCKYMLQLPQLNCPKYCHRRMKVPETNRVVTKLFTCVEDKVEEIDIYCDGKIAMAYEKVKTCKCSLHYLQPRGR